MNRLGNAGDELPGSYAAAVGRWNRQLLGLEGCNGCPQCVLAVRESLFNGVSVGDAIREIGIGDQEAAAFFLRERTNLEWIFDIEQAAALAEWHLREGQAEAFNAAWNDAIARGTGWKARATQGRTALLAKHPDLADKAHIPHIDFANSLEFPPAAVGEVKHR